MMHRKLLLFIVLLAVPVVACARTVDTCMSYDESSKLEKLRGELDARGIKYDVKSFPDNNSAVCVSSDDRSALLAVDRELFPPKKESHSSVKIPPPHDGIPLNSAKLIAPEQQKALETELTKRDIWFTKDKTGAIWYEVTREKEVQDIEFHVAETVAAPSQDDIPVGRNIGYPKKAYADILTNLLTEKGIKSISKHKNGTYWVVWEEKDSSKVTPLIAEAQKRITASEAGTR